MHLRLWELAIPSNPPIYPLIDINDHTLSKSLSYFSGYIKSMFTSSYTITRRLSSVCCHRSVVIGLLLSVCCHQSVVIGLLSSVCCHQSVVISLLSSVCCHQSVVIGLLSSVCCHQSVVISLLAAVCCQQSVVIILLSSVCCHQSVVISSLYQISTCDVFVKHNNIEAHIVCYLNNPLPCLAALRTVF